MLAAGFTLLAASFRGAAAQIHRARPATREDIAAGNLVGGAPTIINVRALREDIQIGRESTSTGIATSPRTTYTVPGWLIGPATEDDDVPEVKMGDRLVVGGEAHTVTEIVNRSAQAVRVVTASTGNREVV